MHTQEPNTVVSTISRRYRKQIRRRSAQGQEKLPTGLRAKLERVYDQGWGQLLD
jgi:hypothetical protein